MSPPRQRDPEATREAILGAAEQMFAAKGFADTSMSELAREAGVTKSLIHHHFGSKEGLWYAVKENRFGEYAEVQRKILDGRGPDGPTAEILHQSVEAYFRFLQKNPQFLRLVTWMHLEDQDDQPTDDLNLIEAGVETIAETQERGELRRDIHPFFMLISFLGLAQHWFQSKEYHCRWAPEGHEVWDDERYLEDMLKIFFEGVLPRPGGEASAAGEGESR